MNDARTPTADQANPPPWDDPFPWTVDGHNAVNILLGKPTMSHEEAWALYAP